MENRIKKLMIMSILLLSSLQANITIIRDVSSTQNLLNRLNSYVGANASVIEILNAKNMDAPHLNSSYKNETLLMAAARYGKLNAVKNILRIMKNDHSYINRTDSYHHNAIVYAVNAINYNQIPSTQNNIQNQINIILELLYSMNFASLNKRELSNLMYSLRVFNTKIKPMGFSINYQIGQIMLAALEAPFTSNVNAYLITAANNMDYSGKGNAYKNETLLMAAATRGKVNAVRNILRIMKNNHQYINQADATHNNAMVYALDNINHKNNLTRQQRGRYTTIIKELNNSMNLNMQTDKHKKNTLQAVAQAQQKLSQSGDSENLATLDEIFEMMGKNINSKHNNMN